jgi:hypothetical protein
VLVGFRSDGSSLAVDLRQFDRGAVTVQAEHFMAEHESCAAVEVWCDGILVHTDGDSHSLKKLRSPHLPT